jgi:hypothetical protein
MIKKNKVFFGFNSLQLFQLVVLYSVAHLGIFFPINSYYWDDYILVGTSDATILQIFDEAGTFFNSIGWLHLYLLKIGPWIYKVLSFILFLLSGLFFNIILKRYDEIFDEEFRFYCVSIFLLVPLYLVHSSLIMIPYPLGFCLFLFAWSLDFKYRIISLILFFLSFQIPSFLVFFIVPFLDILNRKIGTKFTMKTLFIFLINHLDYILLPFVFFAIKIFFFKPYGSYLGYNEGYNLKYLIISPYRMMVSLIETYPWFIIFFFIICIVYFVLNLKLRWSLALNHKKKLALGLTLIIIACFPYWILGKFPTFQEWSNRHLLIVPLGMSVFATTLIFAIFNSQRKLVFSFFLAFCILINIKNYFEFYKDWDKQLQLIMLFKKNTEIQNSTHLIMVDHTKNALAREYRYYEWNGLLSNAFFDESRFAVGYKDFKNFPPTMDYFDNKNVNDVYLLFNCRHSRCADFGKKGVYKRLRVEINTIDKASTHSWISRLLPKYELSVKSF